MTLADWSNLSACQPFTCHCLYGHDDCPLRATEGDSSLLACLCFPVILGEKNGAGVPRYNDECFLWVYLQSHLNVTLKAKGTTINCVCGVTGWRTESLQQC